MNTPHPTPDNQIISPADLDWWHWLAVMFPSHFTKEHAPHHHELWQWLWNIQLGDAPEPGAFIAIWPRGAGLVAEVSAPSARRWLLTRRGVTVSRYTIG